MKKIFLVMLAAAGLAVASCERSFDEGGAAAGGEATVSVNLGFPTMLTRAYSDGTTATELQYAVFEKTGTGLSKIDTYTVTDDEIYISKQIDFQLVTGRTYQFVFWAAAPSEDDWTNPYTVTFAEDGATMAVDYKNAKANDERYDAFFASVEKQITGDVQMSVELTRPFAQINVGTSDYEVAAEQNCAPDLSKVSFSKLYKSLDLVTGEVSNQSSLQTTFDFNEINTDEKFPVPGYDYLAMVYVLASTEEEAYYNVTFSYKEGAAGEATDRTVGSVPFKRNHRTNMFGQVLTSTASVNVIIVPEYEEPDYNYSQLLFAAAVGGTAVLDDDVTLEENKRIQFTKDAVIDLNGKTVTVPDGDYDQADGAFMVKNGANITIKGDGKMTTTEKAADSPYKYGVSILLWVMDDGTATIEDGTFISPNDGEMLYIGNNDGSNITGGTIYIKGGTFIGTGESAILNCLDAAYTAGLAKFVVTGGKFYKYDPSDSAAENPHANWVAPGYKSVKTTIDGEDWYVVVPDEATVVESAEELADAVKTEGATIYATAGTYDSFPASDIAEGVTIVCEEGTVFTGSSSLNIKGATVEGATFKNDSGAIVSSGTINGNFKNCNFEASGNAIRNGYLGDDCTFEGCVFSGNPYAFHIDGGSQHDLTFKGCTLQGFNAFAATINQLTFDDCEFNGDGPSTYNVLNMWGNTNLTNCKFDFSKTSNTNSIGLAASAGTSEQPKENSHTYVFTGCTVNGEALTADDLDLTANTTAKATIDGKEYSLPNE